MRALLLVAIVACVPRAAEHRNFSGEDASQIIDAAAPTDAAPLDATEPEDAAPAEDAAAPDAELDSGVVDAGPTIEPGTLDVAWIHGSADCAQNSDPPFQVHEYNADTVILRQNKCANYEGPFIYLLFGEQKILMLDTGADPNEPVRDTVEQAIATWLGARGRDTIELVVAHTHAHGDHVAGDAQFEGQAGTTVVGTSVAAVSSFFGIAGWPDQEVTFDLGGRTLDVLAIPGHQSSHIAIYDRRTALLITGDTLYPGRLYINDWDAYRASVERLGGFAEANPVTWVLGTHVEMSDVPGVDYPIGTTYQPSEHLLQLDVAILFELRDALRAIGANPQREVHDDFIIAPF